MAPLTLVIGNKNYSSWSLRGWFAIKKLGLAFEEIVIPLDMPETRARLAEVSPSGRVPVLRQGELTVWDSLAICEYLGELTGRGWPESPEARAVARAVSAEMHSGFVNLRAQWPMNARASGRYAALTPAAQAEVARIEAIWTDCRRRFGTKGPWLFGEFTFADAMYAPVVLRFNTYGARLSSAAGSYVRGVLEDSALKEWVAAAKREPWTIASDEAGV
ncbi:MAG TPA: glutathione S-transferase family protein [Steroidobacteraceae bacterium]|nr:glutathione S-transferase family protein [Steroidobacteraceae bacterium]